MAAHDDRLLDALSEMKPAPFEGTAWRVVRDGRSPFDGSKAAGRWNTADVSVLYSSLEADGALSEIYFHLSLGQPVFPSKMRHRLYGMSVKAQKTLKLLDIDQLTKLGVEMERYREILYARTQEIGAAAAFLGFDGLIAPNARFNCANLVLFLDNLDLDGLDVVEEAPVDWAAWKGAR